MGTSIRMSRRMMYDHDGNKVYWYALNTHFRESECSLCFRRFMALQPASRQLSPPVLSPYTLFIDYTGSQRHITTSCCRTSSYSRIWEKRKPPDIICYSATFIPFPISKLDISLCKASELTTIFTMWECGAAEPLGTMFKMPLKSSSSRTWDCRFRNWLLAGDCGSRIVVPFHVFTL